MRKAGLHAGLIALSFIFDCCNPLHAQAAGDNFPSAVSGAHTVAIIDDTHQPGVAQGAADAIKAWGRFTVIDDPDNADLTLRFDKEKERSGHDTQTPADQTGIPKDNSASYGYSLSFSASIHMKVYLKDGDSPFFTARSDDSKKKAGIACVNDFRSAVASHTHDHQATP